MGHPQAGRGRHASGDGDDASVDAMDCRVMAFEARQELKRPGEAEHESGQDVHRDRKRIGQGARVRGRDGRTASQFEHADQPADGGHERVDQYERQQGPFGSAQGDHRKDPPRGATPSLRDEPAVASRFRAQNAVLALPAPKPSPIGRNPTSSRPLFRNQAMPRRSLTTQVRQRSCMSVPKTDRRVMQANRTPPGLSTRDHLAERGLRVREDVRGRAPPSRRRSCDPDRGSSGCRTAEAPPRSPHGATPRLPRPAWHRTYRCRGSRATPWRGSRTPARGCRSRSRNRGPGRPAQRALPPHRSSATDRGTPYRGSGDATSVPSPGTPRRTDRPDLLRCGCDDAGRTPTIRACRLRWGRSPMRSSGKGSPTFVRLRSSRRSVRPGSLSTPFWTDCTRYEIALSFWFGIRRSWSGNVRPSTGTRRARSS